MTIETDFTPAWWLNNAHLQTIYPAFFRTHKERIAIRRERLKTADGDFIDVDFCGDATKPIIILLHGLTGSSRSGYIRGLQTTFLAQGYRTAALNFRGCSGQSNNTSRCYHSGETEDIHFLYQTLRSREPQTAMAAVGFSLGGNVLLKWLGEQGAKLDLQAAVAVSVPFLLDYCATKMDQGFSRLYRNNLLRELKQYIDIKQQYLQQNNFLAEAQKISQLGDISDIKSFWQYDDRVVASLHGFADVHDYYQRSSSRQYIKSICTPTLLIQAADDPFMTPGVIPQLHELSATVELEITQGGGHVGFVGGNIPFKPEFWLDQRIPAYLESYMH